MMKYIINASSPDGDHFTLAVIADGVAEVDDKISETYDDVNKHYYIQLKNYKIFFDIYEIYTLDDWFDNNLISL